MAGPWEKYQTAPAAGPWQKYAAPEQAEAAPPTAPAPTVGVVEDMARSLGTGLRTGVEGVAGMIGDARELTRSGVGAAMDYFEAPQGVRDVANKAIDYVTPFPGAPTTEQVRETITDPLMGADRYQPQTTPGKYARTVGEFAPGAAVGPGGLASRVATNVLAPAIGSEFAGQMTEGTAAEPWARLGGAVVGSQVPGLLKRAVTPLPIPKSRQKMVDVLTREGVDLTAGQKTGRNTLKYMESELGGGKVGDFMEMQGEQFTRAVLKRAGINAARATPDVVDDALNRLGQEFDNLAARNTITPDRQLAVDLRRTLDDYQGITAQSMRAPIVNNLIKDIARTSRGGGSIPGGLYQEIRSRLGKMVKTAKGAELEALHGIRSALDDAMERTLSAINSPDMAAWKEVRRQYRNMIVVEDAVTRAGEGAAQGIISPSALRGAVTRQGKRAYARGKGDLAELARAGEALLKSLPQSGTSPRTAARNLGTGTATLIGGGVGGAAGGGPGALAGMVAGAAVPYATGRAMLSGAGRAYLGNQALADLALPGHGTSAAIAALLARDPSQSPLVPVNRP